MNASRFDKVGAWAEQSFWFCDSFGIGATDDAERFGDAGSDTFGHIAEQRAAAGKPLQLPNLAKLGLFHAGRDSTGSFAPGADPDIEVIGAYGFAEELSSGQRYAERPLGDRRRAR